MQYISAFLPGFKKAGIIRTSAMNDIKSPPIVPMANECQKLSFEPSKRNGINPMKVDSRVRLIGITL